MLSQSVSRPVGVTVSCIVESYRAWHVIPMDSGLELVAHPRYFLDHRGRKSLTDFEG